MLLLSSGERTSSIGSDVSVQFRVQQSAELGWQWQLATDEEKIATFDNLFAPQALELLAEPFLQLSSPFWKGAIRVIDSQGVDRFSF